jgi:rfaE bifunctional protein nucleotidyltransferase chain/domain
LKTVVLANGCFDLFHYGHLKYLQEARTLGDILVVSVTTDEAVNKGPGRPVFNLEQRMAMVRALAIVDVVIFSTNGLDAVEKVKPNVYVKGKEYEGRLREQEVVESYGGRVHFTDGPRFSSTQLLTGGYFRVQGSSSR